MRANGGQPVKTYTSEFMRDWVEHAQRELQMDVRLGKHMQNGQDWNYQLYVDSSLVYWPHTGRPIGTVAEPLTYVEAPAIVGFLYAMQWIGSEVVRDIICEGYDHAIDHPAPEAHRT